MPSSICRFISILCAAAVIDAHVVSATSIFADESPVPKTATDAGTDRDSRIDPAGIRGSLVIAGGGKLPEVVFNRFLRLAGGPKAKLVAVPTAAKDVTDEDRNRLLNVWRERGFDNVDVLHTRDRTVADDAEFLKPLDEATGVWFGGGSQSRFVDAYEGTQAYDALHGVLKRGGVIGGSSAGASIQAEYMARGNPLGNLEIMAEGYERGFNFLPGVAVDQHFAQRKRFADMTRLVDFYPEILGIGIDESTALIVEGSKGVVAGRGDVHFYDRRKSAPEDGPDYESVGSGGVYDLKARAVLKPRMEDGG